MLKIGVTGGIASGKSTVADEFARLGIEVIDADQIARELVEPGSPLLACIREDLGNRFIDNEGRLNRRLLREHVFTHPEDRAKLELILHPAIRREMEIRAGRSRSPYVLLVIPLLVEKGLEPMVDRVLVVDVPESVQVDRLCRRDQVDARHAQRILESQTSREARLAAADDVILNTGSLDDLRTAVERLHRRYLELAESGR